MNVFPTRPGIGDRPGTAAQPLFGARQTTDGEGRFDFGELETAGLELQLTGDALSTVIDWTPPPGVKFSELELRAARRCHMQIDLGDRKLLADSVTVLDEHDQELELWTWMGNMATLGKSREIKDGKSDVFTVPENAVTVVLKKDGVEVQRRPVALKAGALETLHF